MEVHFDSHLESRLTERATRQGRKPDEFVQDVVARYLEEEDRFVEAVKRGEDALERGEYLTHEQVGERLRALFRALMEIRWSVPAAEDLERICQRIERDSPDAARRVAKSIYDGCAQLRDFPNLGRASQRLPGRRELTFPPLPYIVVYQVKQDTVEVSRIFHAAQDWP